MEYKIKLLSVEEYTEYEGVIPFIKNLWWLRTPGYCLRNESCVRGCSVSYKDVNICLGIRPTLLIVNPSEIFEQGSTITVGKYTWTVLRSSEEECYALCTKIVAERRFDAESHDYETSEIKQWLERGFKLFDFCEYCFDCTCDPDGELTPENDFSSCVIGESAEGHRIMLSSGYGMPPRIESEYWNGKVWVTVSSYIPEFCPNCGRKIDKEAYKKR